MQHRTLIMFGLALPLACPGIAGGMSTDESPSKVTGKTSADQAPMPDATEPSDRIRGGFTGATPKKISTDSTGEPSRTTFQSYVPSNTVTPLGLEVVDQTVADRGPLDTSLRQREAGIELPTGFRKVYRLPAESRGEGYGAVETPGERLMRADGGLAAIYDQSIYMQTEEGIAPDVSASTTWVIGGIPLAGEPGHGMLLPLDPLDLGRVPTFRPGLVPRFPSRVQGDRAGFRVGIRAGFMVPPDRATRPGSSSSSDEKPLSGCRFIDDRAYRVARMQNLLDSVRRRIRNSSVADPAVD
ncbi:MAG: hypothetical protein MK085_09200 [Phycisphaerales bacterium]|nr:hypothetical protein [Phycisphaerales bacterium]